MVFCVWLVASLLPVMAFLFFLFFLQSVVAGVDVLSNPSAGAMLEFINSASFAIIQGQTEASQAFHLQDAKMK